MDGVVMPKLVFSHEKLLRYIKKLKRGAAPGCDGIVAEHFKFSINTSMPHHLSDILTVCIRYGVLPKSFFCGILVPILKKPNIDPSIPKNYRPIVISTVFSKIMELAVLEDSSPHDFNTLQFGFVEKRGTNTAICLANDVIQFCNRRGSAVYTCALDAEMAFDGIPHSILLYKSMNVIPDMWWRILHLWYSDLYVQIKWGSKMSCPVKLEKGTRQGGLTSPFLFNLFYQGLAENISRSPGGLRIKRTSYNVFIYADDLLLVSTTVSGLQTMIECANLYVIEHGLCFNASKTSCVTFGKCHFERPTWSLNGIELPVDDELNYLGAILSKKYHAHHQKRCKASRQAFYALQGSGMCNNGVKPNVVSHLWKAMIQPILLYATQSLPMTITNMSEMDKLQAKLIKYALGFNKYYRSTPLTNAMNINKVSHLRDLYSLDLLKSMFYSTSSASIFYSTMINIQTDFIKDSLANRVRLMCSNNNVSFILYLLDDKYHKDNGADLKSVYTYGTDGLTDSVSMLLKNFSTYDKELLKLLLMSF
jgi:hypothetical protein